MKKQHHLLIILFLALLLSCKTDIHPSLKDYVDYIENQNTSAKDYILGLWEQYDMVILCERYHGELTQYDLISDIVESDYFIENVGNVFTEVGSISIQKEIQEFIHHEYSDTAKRDEELMKIYRNLMWPYWEMANFYFFLQDLNTFNSSLPDNKKVQVYTSDIKTPNFYEIQNKEDYLEFKNRFGKRDRDSLIAKNIIQVFDSVRNPRRNKSLVIMNFRHAFSKNILRSNDVLVTNTGDVLNNYYENKVANVYINSLALTTVPIDTTKSVIYQDYCDVPIQDGKWDASFKVAKKENLGFDFKCSPFGKDSLDIWPWYKQYTYQDIFTGMVYYLPIEKHIEAYGINNYVDSAFVDELYKRLSISYDLYGGQKIEKEELSEAFKYKETKYEELDRLTKIINKWIE